MDRFDLLGPLPVENSTTVLEASAGTGKTFALAGLVTRYIAEGAATLDQMLLITFGRAASQELRERVRDQIVHALKAFDDASLIGDNQVVAHLLKGSDDQRATRHRNLRDALASFDAATIATTHQFCQLVLKSLGVAGDSDAGVTLVESLDDLVTEIVDDLYLAHFGQERDDPLLTYKDALRLAREVVNHPSTELRPLDPQSGSRAAVCIEFAKDVLAELDARKRRLGILGYDDLLIRLADALEADDSLAQIRMHRRWPIVMVDEFQDTDPVQWRVIDRAFSGRSTVILIGDPKQAIYAFRGGDIITYLKAAETGATSRLSARTGAATARSLTGCRCYCEAPNSATRASSCTTSTRTTVAADSRVRRAAIRSGCGWSSGRRSAAVGFRTSPSRTYGRTSAETLPRTSERCWPATPRSTARSWWPAT